MIDASKFKVVGFFGGQTLHLVVVAPQAVDRAAQLAGVGEGECPSFWMANPSGMGVFCHASDIEWFLSLDEAIRDARRPSGR